MSRRPEGRLESAVRDTGREEEEKKITRSGAALEIDIKCVAYSFGTKKGG